MFNQFRTAARLAGCALAGTTLLAGTASATCNDPATFMSKQYVYNKGDCAVDAAVDAGKGLLESAGKNLLTAGLNYFGAGGVATLLFGGSDPFAADTTKILGAISSAKADIINAIVTQAFEENQAYWQSITIRAAQWDSNLYPTLASRLTNKASVLDPLVSDLITLQFRFQSHQYKVWHLHAYVTAVQLLLDLEADKAALEAQIDGAAAHSSPDEILRDAEARIRTAWNITLFGGGTGYGVFDYVGSLSLQDFQTESNDRMVDGKWYSLTVTPLGACDGREIDTTLAGGPYYAFNYYDAPPFAGGTKRLHYLVSSERDLVCGSYLRVNSYHLTGSAIQSYNFHNIGTLIANGTAGGPFWVGDPVYSIFPQISPVVDYTGSLTWAQGSLAAESALAGYGAIRPVLHHWAHLAGSPLPRGAQTPSPLDDDVNFAVFSAGTQFATLAPAGRAFGTDGDDSAWASDYAIANGLTAVSQLVAAMKAADPMGSKVGFPGEDVRSFLYDSVDPVAAGAQQKGRFAAKVAAARSAML